MFKSTKRAIKHDLLVIIVSVVVATPVAILMNVCVFGGE